MRNAVVISLTAFVFAGLWYGSVLQDRMRRKAAKSGASFFSLGFQLRALATKEVCLFALLTLVMAGIVAVVIALDRSGYLGPS
jgi:hypothetical protein